MADVIVDLYDEPLSDELEAQIDAAFECANHGPALPAATSVRYLPEIHAIAVQVNTGQRLIVPIEDMQTVNEASPDQLRLVEVLGFGSGIDFLALDVQFSVEGLLGGQYGNRKWMQALAKRRRDALRSAA